MKNFFTKRDESYKKTNAFVIKTLSAIMFLAYAASMILAPDRVNHNEYILTLSLYTGAGLLGMAVLYIFFKDFYFVRYLAGFLCSPEFAYVYQTTQYVEFFVLIVSSNIPVIIYNDKKCTLIMLLLLYLNALNLQLVSKRIYDVSYFVQLTIIAGATVYAFLWAQINLFRMRQQKNRENIIRKQKYENKQKTNKIYKKILHIKETLYVFTTSSRQFKTEASETVLNIKNLHASIQNLNSEASCQKNLLLEILNENNALYEKTSCVENELNLCLERTLNKKNELIELSSSFKEINTNMENIKSKIFSLKLNAEKIKNFNNNLAEIAEYIKYEDFSEDETKKTICSNLCLCINQISDLSKNSESYTKNIADKCIKSIDLINSTLNNSSLKNLKFESSEKINSLIYENIKSAIKELAEIKLLCRDFVNSNKNFQKNTEDFSDVINDLCLNTNNLLKLSYYDNKLAEKITTKSVVLIDSTETLNNYLIKN